MRVQSATATITRAVTVAGGVFAPGHLGEPPRPTRRQKITAIITSQPPRDWTPRELAHTLNVHPRYVATQLREWSLLGFFTHTGLGTYRLNTPAQPSYSTTGPDP